MATDRVEHFGALHLVGGRLWLGKPPKRGRPRPSPHTDVAAGRPTQDGRPDLYRIHPVGPELDSPGVGLDGDDTPMKSHAAEHLPEALRRSIALRRVLASERGIGDLLGRLAGAPDVEAIDRIFEPPTG